MTAYAVVDNDVNNASYVNIEQNYTLSWYFNKFWLDMSGVSVPNVHPKRSGQWVVHLPPAQFAIWCVLNIPAQHHDNR